VTLTTQTWREYKSETHLAFTEYETAFDKVKRRVLSNIQEEYITPNDLLQIINTYKRRYKL